MSTDLRCEPRRALTPLLKLRVGVTKAHQAKDGREGPMKFIFNDGGRAAAGFRGRAGDCVTRAIAIATAKPYREVYDALNVLAVGEKIGKRKKRKSNSREGVFRCTYSRYLESLGWCWKPTMSVGSGCRVHLRASELPAGTLIVRVSKHLTAVIDGQLYDTHDCSRGGTRCVYGYFVRR